ncbi:UNVERIFIED_CONTAM: hypothetical protein RMT77_004211 [Armadillidium vulgare]
MMQHKNSYTTENDIFQNGLKCENRYEKWCSCRTQLEKWLTFGFCFAVISCITISTVLFLSKTTDTFEKKESKVSSEKCETEQCLLTAAEFSYSINKGEVPCSAFYSFACGNNNTGIPSPWYDEINDASYLTRIQEEMRKKEDEKDGNAVLVAKNYFKMCVQEKESKDNELRFFRALMDSFVGWPLIKSSDWSTNNTYNNITLQYSRKGFSSDYLLKFSLKPDLRNTSQNIIYVEPPSNIIPSTILNDINSQYPENLYTMALLLGSPDNNETKKMLKELLQLEMEIAERSEAYQQESPICIRNKMKVLQLKDFKKFLPSVDWIAQIKIIFSNEMIDENTEVVVADVQYLSFFETILEKRSQSCIMNFLTWKLVLETSFYFPSLFEGFRKFHFRLLGIEENLSRNEFCAKLLIRDMPFMHNYFIPNRASLISHSDEATQIVNFVKEVFIDYLSSVPWLDDETFEIASNKLENLKVEIGTSDTDIDVFYSVYNISFGSTFSEVSRYARVYRKVIGISGQKSMEFSSEVFNVSKTIDSFYSEEENLIYFTYGFLSKIFKPGRPNYVHFSRIGFISAFLMFQTIGDKGRVYDAEGIVRNWWTEESLMKLSESVICHSSSKKVWEDQTNEIQWTMFTVAEALNVAYIAYRNWTYEHDLEKPLAGLHLTTEQLFWTSFAQLMCSDHILQEGNRGTSKLYPFKEKERIDFFMKGLKDFSEDWNCKEKDEMYFKKTCDG